MKRIETPNREFDKFGPGKDGFRAGVPGVSDPTFLSADFCNGLQESVVRVIERGGMVPSEDHDQFANAVVIQRELAAPSGSLAVGHHGTSVGAALVDAEAKIIAIQTAQGAGVLGYDTYASLMADLARADKTVAYVMSDPNPANNRTYRKSGVSGAGTWVAEGASATSLRLDATTSTANAAKAAASVRRRPRGPKNIPGLVVSVGQNLEHLAAVRRRPRGPTHAAGTLLMFGSTVVGEIAPPGTAARLSVAEALASSASTEVATLRARLDAEVAGPGAGSWVAEAVVVDSKSQIMVHDGQVYRQITPTGSNWRAPVVEGANIVRCLGDRGGSLMPYRVLPNGFIFNAAEKVLLQKLITGQSLSLGSRGFILHPNGDYEIENGIRGNLFTTGIPEEYRDYCLSLLGGPRPTAGWENSTAFEPIREYADGVTGETTASSWALALRKWFVMNTNLNPRLLATVCGFGGVPYASLKKGTATYNKAIALISKTKAIADSQGLKHVVHSLMIAHGESQDNTTQAEYLAMMNEWVSDYQTDILAITGQTIKPMCFIGQMAGSGAGVTPHINLAQLEAHETNPNICMVGPKYVHQPYFDVYHMLAPGYVKQGEYEARAERFWLQGYKWQPLRPVSIVASGLNTAVKYNNVVDGDHTTPGPIGNLVIDKTLLSDPGNCGYSYSDGTVITGVTLGADGKTVNIATATPPTVGATLSCALQTNLNQPQNSIGRRSNIRDSDTRDMSRFDGAPLYNWSVMFSKPIVNQ
jgi:hypothetical protein